MTTTFWCNYGNHMVTYTREGDCGGTGYAHPSHNSTEKICYECCAVQDRELMTHNGRYTLYLTCPPGGKYRGMVYGEVKVTNWPGTLVFRSGAVRVGLHNIAGKRYDVWFDGPDGYVWHGVTYGDNTQICHVKRTREKINRAA